MSKKIIQMESDHELIKKFQDGSKDAYDILVRRHLDLSYNFFLKFTKDKMDAEDLCQEVFIKLYKSLQNFRFEAAFSSYLYRILLNTANSFIRKAKWKKFLHLDQAPEIKANEQSLEKKMEDSFTKKELWKNVLNLPKKQRMVIILRVAQDLPYKVISDVLGISVGSAKVNYHHGVKQLKNKLEDN